MIFRAWLAVHQDRGASLVEYALLILLIIIVCFLAIVAIGTRTSESFSSVGFTGVDG